jgi:hypothetical protein
MTKNLTIQVLDRSRLKKFLDQRIKESKSFSREKVKHQEYGEAQRSEGRIDAYLYVLDRLSKGDFDLTLDKDSNKLTGPEPCLLVCKDRRGSVDLRVLKTKKKSVREKVERLSPMFCEHANENPIRVCTCPPNCSCRDTVCPEED